VVTQTVVVFQTDVVFGANSSVVLYGGGKITSNGTITVQGSVTLVLNVAPANGTYIEMFHGDQGVVLDNSSDISVTITSTTACNVQTTVTHTATSFGVLVTSDKCSSGKISRNSALPWWAIMLIVSAGVACVMAIVGILLVLLAWKNRRCWLFMNHAKDDNDSPVIVVNNNTRESASYDF
jgi:hypothetical protein